MRKSIRLLSAAAAVAVVCLTLVGSAAAFSASPTSVAFGNVLVGTTATRNVTVTLDAGATFDSVQAVGVFSAFSAAADTCAGAVGPGTCNVKVSFTPPLGAGLNGDLLVKEATPVGAVETIDIPLSGTGVLAFAASRTSVAFGNVLVGTTATQNVTVTLDAGAPFDSVQTFGTGFSANPDTCAGAVGPGTCNVKVSFTPPFDGGQVGDLLIKEVTPVGSVEVIDIPLSGTGVVDNPPTADAGDDQAVNGKASVTLDGTGSSDPDSTDTLTFAWTQTSGPTVTLTGAGTATARFTSPTGRATLTFDLQVCDQYNVCDTDSVTITVRSINDQLTILFDAVKNTPPGKALGDKVKEIKAYVAANDKARSCKGLDEFISLVKAQKGKKLTNAQVADFIAQASAIKTSLGC